MNVGEVSELAPLKLGSMKLTERGIEVAGPSAPTLEQWGEAVHIVALMQRSLGFIVGDLINFGEDHYGEMAWQFIDADYFDEDTTKVYRWICKQVPYENRVPTLGIRYHQLVAGIPKDQQRAWLEKALKGDDNEGPWTTRRLQTELKAAKLGGKTVPKLWLMVEAKDAEDLAVLSTELEGKGRKVKPWNERVIEAPKADGEAGATADGDDAGPDGITPESEDKPKKRKARAKDKE